MTGNKLLLIILAGLFMAGCGTDLAEEGKKAFSSGDYTAAITFLEKLKAEDSTRTDVDQMIFTSYMRRGEDLFGRTKNVTPYRGNYDQAVKYLPGNPDPGFKLEYSKMLLSLGMAYTQTRTSSADEKDAFFNEAVVLVRLAIKADSNNTDALEMLDKLKEENFQSLVDKGDGLIKKASRTRNPDLYYLAEYYLKEAMAFEPDNQKIQAMLLKIRQKTLPVLNYREDVSMAIANIKRERKAILMNISIKNYTANNIKLLLSNFSLVDKTGSIYPVNLDELKKKALFGETCIADTVLGGNNPSTTGTIAFDSPQDAVLDFVEYKISNTKFARKYIP